ncbi:type IV toxin-antitoxin system AbiEi family antitoxin domain-containing protein [Paenibacillus ginsengarvi]|uniref:Abortive infection protein AbiEi n=1 Tax=Paenibacillus ginsengarvi TaxID=400777 RepID=A0A3B0BUJ4_9BACL|nr:type IV toxin-antitoxin system AbiEi family antitoxin domain-containing protein [Paenibacillus ginsengarvi]RKN77103.1 Abortive infection protein AbiEi [Paenibacillus ginsengarvi]
MKDCEAQQRIRNLGGECVDNQIKLKIDAVLESQNGMARTRDFLNEGITHYYIKKLESQGEIIRVKQGLYRHAEFSKGTIDELVEVSKLVPKGVVCLLSALSFYELTTYNPWEYQVAIHRGSKKPKLPGHPPIKVFYLADIQYNLGINEVHIEDSSVSIYDREKTICDIVRYREKIGIDIMKEGLRNYLHSPYKNITKLVQYADKLRIRTVLQKYLEVLI